MNPDYRKQLRKSKIYARNQLSSTDCENFSRVISDRILTSQIFQTAETIMIYKSVNGEVDLKNLENTAQLQNKRLCYPLCISKSEMIALSPHNDLKDDALAWKTGAFGIQEPVKVYFTEIRPAEIDLVICPCTAFDEACGRMGMGAGYYDRFLEKCPKACVAAVAFEAQKTDEIPMEAWDKRMDLIFTEEAVYLKKMKNK